MRVSIVKHQQGITSVIVVVLIGSFLMTALLVGLQQTNMVTYELTDSQDRLKALYLAESALERAAFRYQTISCTSLPETTLNLGDGSIELTGAVLNGPVCDIQVRAVVNNAVKVLSVSLSSSGSSGYEAWAVGQKGVIVGRSGGVWSVVTSNVSKDLNGIACTDVNYCIAVGKDGWVTVWNGSVWTPNQINKEEEFNAVSCSPSDVNFCVIVGKGDDTEGVTRIWNRVDATPGITAVGVNKELLSVDCPDSTCVAVGKKDENAFTIRGNGLSWTVESSNVENEILGVSCLDTSATSCWGASNKKGGKFILVERPGPGGSVTWETNNSTPASGSDVKNLFTISCIISSGECWAAGKKGRVVKYNSSAWSYYGQIDNADIFAIDCRESDGSCLAVGKNVIMRWDGLVWSEETLSPSKKLYATVYLSGGGIGGGSVNVQNWQEVVSGS